MGRVAAVSAIAVTVYAAHHVAAAKTRKVTTFPIAFPLRNAAGFLHHIPLPRQQPCRRVVGREVDQVLKHAVEGTLRELVQR